jgi:O-antigen/teichoic acid export membrane protein
MASKIEKSLSAVAKGAGIIFIGIVIGNVLGLTNQILMGRFLGPENYGLFYLAVSIIMILCALPQFGLGAGLTQFIPFYSKKKRNDKVKAGIDFSLKFGIVVSILVSSILFILSDEIAIRIFDTPELGIVLKILCFALPFWALRANLGMMMQAFKKPEYYSSIENILMKVVQISIFLIAIFLGYKLFGALFAFIAAVVTAVIAYCYVLFKKLYPSIKKPTSKTKRKISVRKELVALSWPLFLAGFTKYMMYADRIILGIYTVPAAIGIYTAAFTIAHLMQFIFYSFSFNFRPIVAEYFAVKDNKNIEKLYSSITKWTFLLTFPAIIYFIFYAKDAIWLIYGDSFTTGSTALIILSMGIAMNGLTGLTGEVLVAIRKTKFNLLCEVIGALTNIGLNLILIPYYGIIGAAIGTSISISVRNLSQLTFVYKELKIHPYNNIYIRIVIASISTMVLISFLFNSFLNIPFAFILVIPIFLVLYFIILFKSNCLDQFDKSLLKSYVKKLGILNKNR